MARVADSNARNRREGFADLDPIAGPDGGNESYRLASYWKEQIKRVDASMERWHKRGMKIERRYCDERNRSDEEGQRRTNNLWCNTEIMMAALYGKAPLPVAERRFKDKDPIGLTAAMIIERGLRNDMDFNHYHESVGDAVLDFLLPGLGVVWVRYEPEIGRSISIPTDQHGDLRDEQGDIEGEDPEDDEDFDQIEDEGERLISESAPVDYVHWRDFYMFPAKVRKWAKVDAIAKRLFLSYDEMCDRWGSDIADRIPLQKEDPEKDNSNSEARRTQASKAEAEKADGVGVVFEIWHKKRREVVWVADGCDFTINRSDDPLQLTGFWPTPKPLFANPSNSKIIPTPFYIQYQDQAIEIDEITQRSSQLTKAIKLAGIYDASADSLARLLDESVENELIPEDAFRSAKEKGGLEGMISLLPIEQAIEALRVLMEKEEKVQAKMDRLSGLTDVMRGETTDARETLGRGRMNENNGKTRLRQQQDRIAEFCRDVTRIQAEIMSKHWSNRSLVDASGILYEEGLNVYDIMDAMEGDPDDEGAAAPPPPPSHLPLPAPPPAGNNVVAFPGSRPPPPGSGAPAPASAPIAGGPQGINGSHPLLPPLQGGSVGAGGAPMPGMPQPGMPPGQPPHPAQPPPLPPEPPREVMILKALQKVQAALKLIRDDHKRGFRIDIEVDSTIVSAENAERENRTQFIESVTKFIVESGQVAMQQPAAAPLMGKMLQFAVRAFRPGRDLENAINEFVDKAEKMAKAAEGKPKPPSPEEMKAKAAVEAQQVKTQGEMQRQQAQAQNDQREAAANVQLERMKMQLEAMKAHFEQQAMQQEAQIEQMRAHLESAKLTSEHQIAIGEHQMRIREGAMDQQRAETEHQQALEHGAAAHAQSMEATELSGDMAREGHRHSMAQMKQKAAGQ